MTFLEKINREVEQIPKRVRDYADTSLCGTKTCVAEIYKYRGKLYEVVYGIKHLSKGCWVQKLLVVTEDGKIFNRNCFYEDNWYGTGGFRSWGYDKKTWYRNYYETYQYEPYFAECDSFPVEKVYMTLLTTEEELAEIDESLKYAHYKNYSIEPMSYIRLYRKHPRSAEMLMRFVPRYDWITEKNLEQLDNEPRFFRWVERHHSELSKMSFRTAHNAYKKNPQGNAEDYAGSLSYRISCGRELAQSDNEMYKKVLEHTSREKLCEWLSDNQISTRLYFDYIKACDWLRLRLSDTKVLYPKNFMEMHDLYCAQYAETDYYKELNKSRLEREKAERISAEMKAVADKFSFLNYSADGYETIVATSKKDLIDEGANLNICVGRMTYDERQARGESIICFIRKAVSPTTSFVCTEVKVGTSLKIVQCYGQNNKLVPEVSDFTEKWMKKANRLWKKTA